MTDMFCSYPGNRAEALVAYVYDDITASERTTFEAHLLGCATCQREIENLGGVRARLASWAPPTLSAMRHPAAPAVTRRRWWQEVPAWAQVAAALLFLGTSAGIANLDVRYDAGGLSVRTGWSAPAPAVTTAATQAAGEGRPWQADLAGVEQRLRLEMREQAAAFERAAPTADHNPAEIMRQVKALVDEAERREQRELALRVAELFRDVQAQRQADLAKIDRTIGVVQNSTGFEVMRQRELLNSLAVRVSQSR
jgi:hypothetical protein